MHAAACAQWCMSVMPLLLLPARALPAPPPPSRTVYVCTSGCMTCCLCPAELLPPLASCGCHTAPQVQPIWRPPAQEQVKWQTTVSLEGDQLSPPHLVHAARLLQAHKKDPLVPFTQQQSWGIAASGLPFTWGSGHARTLRSSPHRSKRSFYAAGLIL